MYLVIVLLKKNGKKGGKAGEEERKEGERKRPTHRRLSNPRRPTRPTLLRVFGPTWVPP